MAKRRGDVSGAVPVTSLSNAVDHAGTLALENSIDGRTYTVVRRNFYDEYSGDIIDWEYQVVNIVGRDEAKKRDDYDVLLDIIPVDPY